MVAATAPRNTSENRCGALVVYRHSSAAARPNPQFAQPFTYGYGRIRRVVADSTRSRAQARYAVECEHAVPRKTGRYDHAERSRIQQRRAGGPRAAAGRRREQVLARHAGRHRGQRALSGRSVPGGLRRPAHGRRLHRGVHQSVGRPARARLSALARGAPARGSQGEPSGREARQTARLPRRLRLRRRRRRSREARSLRAEARRRARAGGRHRPGRARLRKRATLAEAALPQREPHRGHAARRRGGAPRTPLRPACRRSLRARRGAVARLWRDRRGERARHVPLRRRADGAHGARHSGVGEGGHGRCAGRHDGRAAGAGARPLRGVRAGRRAARPRRVGRRGALVDHRCDGGRRRRLHPRRHRRARHRAVGRRGGRGTRPKAPGPSTRACVVHWAGVLATVWITARSAAADPTSG